MVCLYEVGLKESQAKNHLQHHDTKNILMSSHARRKQQMQLILF